MHTEAFEYVSRFATHDRISVIEIGSRNVNGSVRSLFPNAKYLGIDIEDGEGVDVVVDAMEFEPDEPVDLVICCEVLEHESRWIDVVHRGAWWLTDTGRLIITVAGPKRGPHSAFDGGPLQPGEYYSNVSREDLAMVMADAGLQVVAEEGRGGQDVYAVGDVPC